MSSTILLALADDTDSILDMLSRLESGSGAIASILSLIASIFTGGIGLIGFIISIIISILSLLITIGLYLVQAIGIYNMAKRAGHNYAWLAWIPIANFYLIAVLSNREFNLFNYIRFWKRDKVFWIYLLLLLGGNTLVAIISSVLAWIPIIGTAFAGLLPLLLSVILMLIKWRFMYDFLVTMGKQDNAMLLSIISVFISPIFSVLCFIMRNSTPDYGAGNFSSAFAEAQAKTVMKNS